MEKPTRIWLLQSLFGIELLLAGVHKEVVLDVHELAAGIDP
jgi:hypothetical protein